MKLAILFSLLFILMGCKEAESFEPKVTSVQLIDQVELANITGNSYEALEKFTNGKYYKVDVLLDFEVKKYILNNDVTPTVHYSFCEENNHELALGLSQLYASGSTLFESLHRDKAEKIDVMSFIIYASWNKKEAPFIGDPKEYVVFDLERNPRDICSYIGFYGVLFGDQTKNIKINIR